MLHERREKICLKFAQKCLKNPKTKDWFPLNVKSHQMTTRKTEKYLKCNLQLCSPSQCPLKLLNPAGTSRKAEFHGLVRWFLRLRQSYRRRVQHGRKFRTKWCRRSKNRLWEFRELRCFLDVRELSIKAWNWRRRFRHWTNHHCLRWLGIPLKRTK